MNELETQLESIAARHLRFSTLKVRGSDRLDFKEVYCESLREALLEAYQLGLDKRDAAN